MLDILKEYCDEARLREGAIIDVGANDGVFLSWSIFFESAGFNVLCIEGNEQHREALEKNRKNAVLAVLSNKEEVRDFYVWESESSASYTGLIPHRDGATISQVTTRTLNSVLEEKGITKITMLGIDVEGGEPLVLQGFDFEKYQPIFIMVEEHFMGQAEEAKRILLEKGYTPLRGGAGGFDVLYYKEELCLKP
jgi:FkbM family methyltransferase